MSGRALFVGDVSLDLTMVVDHLPAPDEKVHVHAAVEAPGGVVANAAVACALAGAPVSAWLRLGNDAAAEMVRTSLAAASIALDSEAAAGSTCRVVVILEPHGEKRLLLDPGVTMYPSVEWVRVRGLDGMGWVHTAVYGAAARDLAALCRTAGVPFSLDLEPATFADGFDAIADIAAGAEAVFCNERAVGLLGAAGIDRLFASGVRTVVRTLGPAGAELRTPAGGIVVSAPTDIRIVDTTGGGDCLAGWFIAGRLAGKAGAEALEPAVIAATLSCGRLGAQASYPTAAEVAQFRAA